MKENKDKNINIKLWCIMSFVFVILWMGLVFCFSASDATESSNTSSGFIKAIVKIFYRGIDEVKLEQIVEKYQFIVRKAAHFTIYLIGGILLYNLYFNLNKNYIKIVNLRLWSIISGVLYAISDEIHQYFVPGRSCEIRDVLIDSSGVILGTFIIYYFIRIFYRKFRKDDIYVK